MKKYILKSNVKFLLIAIICLVILTFMILPVKEKNRLKLNGQEQTIIRKNEDYIEEGVTYKGKNIIDQVVIQDNLDTTKLGTYQIQYTYQTERGKTLKVIREVIVEE